MPPIVATSKTVSPEGSQDRAARGGVQFPLLAGGAIAAPIALLVLLAFFGHGPRFNDFHDYWLAAKLVTQGHSPYDIGALRALAAAEGLPFLVGTGYSYPPPFAVAMVPFAALPFDSAVLLFTVISLVTFGLTTAAWIGWAHGSGPEAARRRVLLAVAAGAYAPVFETVTNGQVNLVIVAALALGTALGVGGSNAARSTLGGIAIGLAGVVKLVPMLVLVPFAIARRGGLVVGLLVGSLGSLVVAGLLVPGIWAGSSGMAALFEPDAYVTNQSINGIVSRLVESTDHTLAIWPDAFDPLLPVVLLTGLLASATGLALWRARSQMREQRGFALGIALALTAALVGAPKASASTQVLSLLSVGLLVAVDGSGLQFSGFGRTDRWLLTGWFAGAMVQAAAWNLPPAPTAALAPLITLLASGAGAGTLALWCLLVRRIGRPGTPAPSEDFALAFDKGQ